ncbi:hypothetical protein [Nitratiruptor tergarcus]|uniref:Uncharacterized protein n=1 Tax=Nitratiruptor tergarcus DSM 16512 TaxID=1069081 RepID=A0A1W1WTE7_9BACT|nr:hypothetical protein [Nitratiruptor tergarcus]SMC09506.1 hypothetical protein SAMN05660197_1319 [Nitratiruptor tergarcus DSM 16512]
MRMPKIGVREFTKSFNKLQNMEIVEIVDKKTNELKGIYLSKEQAIEFLKYLREKKQKAKEEKLRKIMQYAGAIKIDEKFENLSSKELKTEIAKAKAGINGDN